MATTTAAVTLSSDLLSDNISVTTDTTCVKGGTTADGLDQMDMGYIEIATGTNFDLLDADNALNKDKANKVYIANESTDETYYVIITIDATVVGRLYAGDWMFIPWSATGGGTAADHNDIVITPSASTDMTIESALIYHED